MRLDIMTFHDHDQVMNTASVSEFKSRLSAYLRGVRQGRPLTIMDRRHPVARVVPVAEPSPGLLESRLPRAGAGAPGRVKLPPALRLSVDPVEILLVDRASRG